MILLVKKCYFGHVNLFCVYYSEIVFVRCNQTTEELLVILFKFLKVVIC